MSVLLSERGVSRRRSARAVWKLRLRLKDWNHRGQAPLRKRLNRNALRLEAMRGDLPLLRSGTGPFRSSGASPWSDPAGEVCALERGSNQPLRLASTAARVCSSGPEDLDWRSAVSSSVEDLKAPARTEGRLIRTFRIALSRPALASSAPTPASEIEFLLPMAAASCASSMACRQSRAVASGTAVAF